jgi:uncharacterized membrane protein
VVLMLVWMLVMLRHGHGGAAWLLPVHALLLLLQVARCAGVPASLHILQDSRKQQHR